MIVTDQLGRKVEIPDKKQLRIVSLVPSQTELLYDLGANIVGQTIFCVHPKAAFKSSFKVGGTKKLHLHKIRELKPDLIIANKEENEKSQIEELAKDHSVWISDIRTIDDALEMIAELGKICNNTSRSAELIDLIRNDVQWLSDHALPTKKVAYAIWKDPWMFAGKDTFIDKILNLINLENVFGEKESRYPEADIIKLKEPAPELILLSSEPFPFKKEHMEDLKETLPGKEIHLVDGEYFSWYGSRLAGLKGYLTTQFPDWFR